MGKTRFKHKVEILSDLWLHYRNVAFFSDFMDENDLGLPLAYTKNYGLVNLDDGGKAKKVIKKTFTSLLDLLEVDDGGFECLDDLIQWSDLEIDYDEEVGGYREGFEDGAASEQERVQNVVKFFFDMYIEEGKGQKAVTWKQMGEALVPIQMPTDEEYYEQLRNEGF